MPMSVRDELLILLHSYYPERVTVANTLGGMKARSSGTIRNRLNELRTEKLLHGDPKIGYRLTQTGYSAALQQIRLLS
jgi:predicted transcriptional regulator